MADERMPQTLEELRAFVDERVRKALAEIQHRRGWEPYTPRGLETKAVAPSRHEDLPAWTRQEGGTAH